MKYRVRGVTKIGTADSSFTAIFEAKDDATARDIMGELFENDPPDKRRRRPARPRLVKSFVRIVRSERIIPEKIVALPLCG